MELPNIPERDRHLLFALALMCEQYLGREHEGRRVLDHLWMTAGEEAYKALAAYDLIEVDGRGATWTPSGLELLGHNLEKKPFPR